MEKGFKPTYLKTIHNQLSAILNYAVNFYDLRSNPCRKAGSMGKSKADERPYWTLEEFQKFSDAIMDKQDSWIAFQILFWTGMRIGELLALQVKDIDFKQGKVKAYTNEIIKIERNGDVLLANEKLQKLLCQYPNSVSMKFHAVTLITSFQVMHPECAETQRNEWEKRSF